MRAALGMTVKIKSLTESVATAPVFATPVTASRVDGARAPMSCCAYGFTPCVTTTHHRQVTVSESRQSPANFTHRSRRVSLMRNNSIGSQRRRRRRTDEDVRAHLRVAVSRLMDERKLDALSTRRGATQRGSSAISTRRRATITRFSRRRRGSPRSRCRWGSYGETGSRPASSSLAGRGARGGYFDSLTRMSRRRITVVRLAQTSEGEWHAVEMLCWRDAQSSRQSRRDIHGARRIGAPFGSPESPEDDRDPTIIIPGSAVLRRIVPWRTVSLDERIEGEEDVGGSSGRRRELQPIAQILLTRIVEAAFG